MNALQKRLEEIGTEPHENGLRDAIVYKDAKDQCYWIYNHYSHCEWLKHYIKIACLQPRLKTLRIYFSLRMSLPIITQWR